MWTSFNLGHMLAGVAGGGAMLAGSVVRRVPSISVGGDAWRWALLALVIAVQLLSSFSNSFIAEVSSLL